MWAGLKKSTEPTEFLTRSQQDTVSSQISNVCEILFDTNFYRILRFFPCLFFSGWKLCIVTSTKNTTTWFIVITSLPYIKQEILIQKISLLSKFTEKAYIVHVYPSREPISNSFFVFKNLKNLINSWEKLRNVIFREGLNGIS